MKSIYFNSQEQSQLKQLCRQLLMASKDVLIDGDFSLVKKTISDAVKNGHYRRDRYGINPVIHNIQTSILLCEKISPDRNMLAALLLYRLCQTEYVKVEEIEKQWGQDVAKLIKGLLKVASLYSRQAAMDSDNFRNLLLTFAEDIRVIILMIVDRLSLM
jgi:GTP pyrophosphokinase